jgi:glucose/arabinose dehydrogenase
VRRLAVIGLALLAACGGDTSSEPSDPTSATDTTTSLASSDRTAPSTAPPSTGATSSSSNSTPVTTAPPVTTVETTPAVDPTVTFTEIGRADVPTDLAWRDGDPALYVVEQRGVILRLADGGATEVLDARELTDAGGERGFLGLTFAPDGDVAYVNYTDREGTTTISEYPVAPDGRFLAGDDVRVLFTIEQPYPNHNGGDLLFGPDQMLYIGMGDGGSRGDPERRALDLTTPLGKILRIDPTPTGGVPYTVPADNPFVGTSGADPRIWSLGLRNPWRLSFDRITGDLWIGDVGQDEVEEMDVAPAVDGLDAGRGLSFGWSAFEGNERYNEDVPEEGHVPPFLTYTHSDTNGCSISGGIRVRNGSPLDGWVVYGDYCGGQVWATEVLGEGADLRPGRTLELATVGNPTAVVEGPDSEVYVLAAAGEILRVDAA